MAIVKAKEPCYVGGGVGYKTPEDGEFEYAGTPHNSLEVVKGAKPAKTDEQK